MTTIETITLPKDERGNDPNDFRHDPSYMERLKQPKKTDMSWVEDYSLSDAEVKMLTVPDWVYKDLIIEGHVVAIPAPPNGGKTTILRHIAGQIADKYKVYYVNADVAGGDAKEMVQDANDKGFIMLLPDMKAGKSMDGVVKHLAEMNKDNKDYSGMVFIFDTLKKMTDVINKSRAKGLYKVLRGLSAKGMTIVLLAHTNKYNDSDGKPIYEGTGDLRADVDELIYMVPKKNDDGSMIVSTIPDKVRGVFRPITFTIAADRTVSLNDEFVDVARLSQIERQRDEDDPVVEAIIKSIRAGKVNQSEILGYCKERHKISWRQARRVLARYESGPLKLWGWEQGAERNRKEYSLVSGSEASSEAV